MRPVPADIDRGRRIGKAEAYLAVPRDYCTDLGGGVRWSVTADTLEYADGTTFVFAAEVIQFLEGFASQRPLIPFGCALRVIYLLWPRPGTPAPSPAIVRLRDAFGQTRRSWRNAGVFAARLCAGVPDATDPPTPLELWRWLLLRQSGLDNHPPHASETSPVAPPAIETRIERALAAYAMGEMVAWLRHGTGLAHGAAEPVAEVIVHARPRSLEGVLAEAARRERLGGAVPFVGQLVSALALPPRRLDPPELPMGGYTDVATRGNFEQMLPSQLAYDDLEFLRRAAQRELLFFRREEPQAHTREDLVVLLDQSVRTWGVVRLVLAAAVFALGKLANRRRMRFLFAATSNGGEMCDPSTTPAGEFGALLEASDLGADPGPALERVLEAPAEAGRDVVLLTHPRNFSEEGVIAAARRVRRGVRLFAVAVDEQGTVQSSELRHGLPVPLARIHVDLTSPVARPVAAPAGAWLGDVEPVPYPFPFGPAGPRIESLAFDHAGDWLLVATADGMLFATRTDGSRTEVLPRGAVGGQVVTEVGSLLGVVGGFVVIAGAPPVALHYDFRSRTCRAYPLPTVPPPLRLLYLRRSHTLVVLVESGPVCVNLSSGHREVLAAAQALWACWRDANRVHVSATVRLAMPVAQLEQAETFASWPTLWFDPVVGRVAPRDLVPAWDEFTPLADGKPVLAGCELKEAVCQGDTLAAVFMTPTRNLANLHVFRGPKGTPQAIYRHHSTRHLFALSADGRLLARQSHPAAVAIHDVLSGGQATCGTRIGHFHQHVDVELGDGWLALGVGDYTHLLRWGTGKLKVGLYRGTLDTVLQSELAAGSLPGPGTRAREAHVPAWLQTCAGRFRRAAWGHVIAAVDRFGHVAVFRHDGTLVCVYFAFRKQIAGWMPDGTAWGAEALLGRPATPGTDDKIGQALRDAEAAGRVGSKMTNDQ
jgi:hypothetical protein